MAEHHGLSTERRNLLLADGLLSVAALQQCLDGATPAGPEAALHLIDLASLLASLGLKPEAQALKGLGRGLAEDPSSAALDVLRLLPHLRQLIETIQDDEASALASARQSLAQGLQLALVPAPWPITPPDKALAASMSSLVSEPLAGSSRIPAALHAALPLFSTGLAGATDVTAAVKSTTLAVPFQPDWQALRVQLLEGVQEASAWVQAQRGIGPEILLKLSATQDGLVRVGQLPLQQVYPDAQGAAACWADPLVLQLLDHLAIFSQRASWVSVQVRNLTLFVQWRHVSLSQSERQHIGEKVAEAKGRVDLLDAGVQLVLPSSAQRMRMVSYRSAGQWHAVCWAQFLGWDETATQQRLRLQCGLHTIVVAVEQAGDVSNMSLYPWPKLVPGDVGLEAVALDGNDRLHLVRRHSS